MRSAINLLSSGIIIALFLNVSIVFGGSLMDGSFMFRKKSADQLAEVEAIVTSQKVAGMILSGKQKFKGAPTSTNSSEIYLVIRVRALTNQTIWGMLACTVDERSPVLVPVTHTSKSEGWAYFVVNYRGAGIKHAVVKVKWERIYAK